MEFFTQEMSDEMKRMAETNPDIQAQLEGMNISFIMVCTDCPGDEDRQMTIGFKNGKLVESTLQVKPAPSDLRTEPVDTTKYAAKVVGPYDVMSMVTMNKLPRLAALGSMRFEGDMLQLMGNITGLTSLFTAFGKMPSLES
jgi:hypothetical protein